MNIKMSLEISVFFLEFTVNISITYHYVNNKFELISNSMWFRYCHRELSINQLSLSGIDFSLFYWKLTKTIILLQIHHESTIFLAILQCIRFFIPNPKRIHYQDWNRIFTSEKSLQQNNQPSYFNRVTENNQMINYMI